MADHFLSRKSKAGRIYFKYDPGHGEDFNWALVLYLSWCCLIIILLYNNGLTGHR